MRSKSRNWSVVGLVIAALIAGSFTDVNSSLASPGLQANTNQIEPKAGTWKTWVLTSGSQFRLPVPPDKTATQEEIKQLKDMADKRSTSALDQIAYWDTGSPSYRWNEIALNEILKNPALGALGTRDLALLHVAIYDSLIAAWDTKYSFNRLRPSAFDPTLKTVLSTPNSPSYPSEHAVVAGAASAVLAYEFPEDAKLFADMADQAGKSRLMAGVDYPSDVKAGLELGQKVAALVIERGKADGSDAKWTGSVPTEKGKWTGTDLVCPMCGSWNPWVLSTGNEFRPGPPPAYDSDQEKAELAEVENFKRTPKSNADAFFWQYGAGPTRVAWFWKVQTTMLISAHHVDTNPPRAARIYALESVANYDGTVACFDAKYTYWAIRPFQLDPNFKPLFPTPNHPSYPSAHSCISGSSAGILAYFFPTDAKALFGLAEQAGESRIWAGIHFRSDIVVGAALAQKVAAKVIAYAQSDGATP